MGFLSPVAKKTVRNNEESVLKQVSVKRGYTYRFRIISEERVFVINSVSWLL